MTEAAAFIHYVSEGEASGGKGRGWDALTSEQKQERVPQDVSQYVRSKKDWRPLLEAFDLKAFLAIPADDKTDPCLRNIDDISHYFWPDKVLRSERAHEGSDSLQTSPEQNFTRHTQLETEAAISLTSKSCQTSPCNIPVHHTFHHATISLRNAPDRSGKKKRV